VNIQINLSSLHGVTIKTINTNGEVQQTVEKKKVILE
jgi:hypothetical protein